MAYTDIIDGDLWDLAGATKGLWEALRDLIKFHEKDFKNWWEVYKEKAEELKGK